MSVDLAIDYLTSDEPFQHRLGAQADEERKGDAEGKDKEEGKENKQEEKETEKEKEKGDGAGEEGEGRTKTAEPLHEALCDTIWGVDVMVRPSR